jgi:polysaccharide pyruvyl transferase WcaK-like protein
LDFLRRILSRITPWIAALESVDFAGDVRGGDSFSDIYGLKGFLHGFLEAWTVLLVKGTMVQFPQTYGPYKSKLAHWLARYVLRRSSVIIARDKESQNVAQELVGPNQKVLLSPDVAFSLEAVAPQRIELDPPISPSEFPLSAFNVSAFENRPPPSDSSPSSVLRPSSSDAAPISAFCFPLSAFPKPIGLNISGLMFNGGYTRENMFGLKLDYAAFLPTLVVALLREHEGELWLVPHTYGRRPDSVEDDLLACRQVRGALPPELQQRVRLVTGEYDCHQLKHIIGQCAFFIGSRMHACIAALSQGLPAVGVAYSKKFAGVFDSVGMGDWVVDARDVSSEQAVASILELFRRRHLVGDGLRQRSQEARARLPEVFARLVMAARPAAGVRGQKLAAVQP